MIQLLRDINKLTLAKTYSAFFTKWTINGDDIDDDADLLFPDGVISLNSSSQCWVSQFQADNNSVLVTDGSDLIKKYSLVDGDVFVGRDENYLLFKNGSLDIKSEQLNIDCNDVNITVANAVTINGVALTFVGGKMLINGIETAIVGGDIDTTTKKIISSGQ